MNKKAMSSMERVLTTLSHKEPDRVPLFLLAAMHGAKELGVTIKDYFSKGDNVVEGQLRIRKKYRNDCIYPFFYTPLEIEAFGGSVIYSEDGPPNAGEPFITDVNQIKNLQPPRVKDTKVLHKVLESIQKLKATVKDEVPIIAVVISPFSLPVMQLGFEQYLNLMHLHTELFEQLIKINEEFCVDWANAQLEAGATAICFFDPVSSTTVIPKEKYLQTGFLSARHTIARIKGPTATHFASGNCLPIIDEVAQTGTAVIGVSTFEDIGVIKEKCKNKLTVLGNLNGIEMRRWTPEQTQQIVKNAITQAAPGGGFILSDNHGEIPFLVPEDVLLEISEAVHTYGEYPIRLHS
ncbi:MAG: uroporphyrinogen decarboxylase family protein [Ignavibacteria bacterium]